MVTIPHIDVMTNNGNRFYITLRNVKVRGTLTFFADGEAKEIPDVDEITKEVYRLLPSIAGRKDIRLVTY